MAEIKVQVSFPTFTESYSQCLTQSQFDALVKILRHLQTRYTGKLYVAQFPLCQAVGQLGPLQVKAEIDKVCLLCAPQPYLESEDKNYLKAVYLVTNYIAGSYMDSSTQTALCNDKISAEAIAKHMTVLVKQFTLDCPQLTQLIREITAKVANLNDRIKNVTLDEYMY